MRFWTIWCRKAKNAADVHGSSFSFVISPRIRVGKSTQTAFPPPCPLTSLLMRSSGSCKNRRRKNVPRWWTPRRILPLSKSCGKKSWSIRVGKSTQTAFPPPCPLTSLPSGMGYAPETKDGNKVRQGCFLQRYG